MAATPGHSDTPSPAVPVSSGAANDDSVRLGRRVFLGLSAVAGLGLVVGGQVQNFVNRLTGGSLAALIPGAGFRIYSITGTYPSPSDARYRLKVSGLVDHPTTYTLADLKALPATSMVSSFQCVTGWNVPGVQWEGVRLSHLLDAAGIQPGAGAISFDSYDNTDTESLTIDQAHLHDVIVAYKMLGAPVTREHGGPVRLYVAQMFGYKSLKWLSGIRAVKSIEPGYWEQNGYPTNGWRDGSTGLTNPSPQLT